MLRADIGLASGDPLLEIASGILGTIALGAVFTLLAVGITTWVMVRRIRKSGVTAKIRGGVENAVSGGLLKVRAETSFGVKRELAKMRLRLKASLDATARSIDVARSEHRPVGDLPVVLGTLSRAGSSVDAQLALAEREPDAAMQESLAATLRVHVRDIEKAALEIRTTLSQTGTSAYSADVEDASTRLTAEARVLESWSQTYRNPWGAQNRGDESRIGMASRQGGRP